MKALWLNGLRAATRNWVPALWVYLLNLACALPIALLVAALVSHRFGTSLAGAEFGRGVDPALLAEFLRSRGSAFKLLTPVLCGCGLLWLALSTYLSGAVLAAVSSPVPPRSGAFLAEGGRVFGRLLRLLVFGGLWTAIAFGVPTWAMWRLADVITKDWVSEGGVLLVNLSALALTLLLLCMVNGAYDLMKVEAVTRGERRAHWAFVHGLRAAFRRPLLLLGTYIPLAGGALLLSVVASLIDVRLPRSGWVAVLLGLLLQQAVSLSRAFLRVGLTAAEVALLRGDTGTRGAN